MAFEMYQFNYPSGSPPKRWNYLDQTFFTNENDQAPIQETPDGMFLLPRRVLVEIPVVSTSDGSQKRLYSLSNYTSIEYSTVLLDWNNLYIIQEDTISVVDFRPAKYSSLEFIWTFSWSQSFFDNTVFEPILPKVVIQAVTLQPRMSQTHQLSSYLLVRTTNSITPDPNGQDPIDGDTSDRLWAFNAILAPTCANLPNSGDNCGYCDGQTGVNTARNCAYCVESSSCTEYYFAGQPAFNQTCSDEGYPLDMKTCNGKDSDRTVAIVVGCVCGAIILLSIGICYLAKKKMSPQAAAAAREVEAHGGNYQSV